MKPNQQALALLRAELEQNGIASAVPELVQHKELLIELDYALRPIVHEGKIQPYGFIVCNCPDSPIYHKFSQDIAFDLTLARRLADGCHSFVIFAQEHFRGIFPLNESAGNELRLLELQQVLKAIVCITDSTGTTKIFCNDGVFIHQHRQWQKKPSLTQALANIEQCIPPVNSTILKAILEFCFYELSPQKIGATLVWCLEDLQVSDLERLLPNNTAEIRAKIEININDVISKAVLRHVLTYTDGAIFLDQDGAIIGGGAHLKYSENSRRLISTYRGTRHTSAKRFSFDFPETIVFVVSSDGFVTVFSDGMNIVNLSLYAADRSNMLSIACDSDAASTQIEVVECQTCRKTCHVHLHELETFERSIPCPICNNFLYVTNLDVLTVYVTKNGLSHSG